MNFNPLAAMASCITIAQVEKLGELGAIDPATVHVPGVFVQRIVLTGYRTSESRSAPCAAPKGQYGD